MFMPLFGSSSYNNNLEYLKYFLAVPELNAVINKKALMFSKMTLDIVSKQTGEPVKNYEYLVKVLRNPNWYQAQKEFLRQTKLFRDIGGNEYLYFNKAFGLPFKSVRSMYTLPFYMVCTKTPDDKPFFMYDTPVIEYSFKWKNKEYPLDQSAMIQFNDNRVDMKPDNWVTGQSKIEPLKGVLNNIIAAYESRNVLIESRGALGILSNATSDVAGAVTMSPEQKQTLQDEWRQYGLLKRLWHIIISNHNLKWTQISVDDPSKLGLFEEIEQSFQRICDAYGVDRDMFGNVKGATFENKRQGERSTWNNTIIPECLEWVDGLNDTFNTGSESWKIVAKFVNIDALNENLKERGVAFKQMVDGLHLALADQAITIEDYQKELSKFNIALYD